MKNPRFTIVLKGSTKDKGKLRLDEFIRSLEVIIDALKDTERRIRGMKKPTTQYRIVSIKQNSPAVIVIEPVTEIKKKTIAKYNTQETFGKFVSNLSLIKKNKTVPEDMDYHAIEKYLELSNLRHTNISSIELKNEKKHVLIDEKFGKNIGIAIGEDEVEYDTLTGELDTINIHGNKVFYIYPLLGATKIRCTFTDSLLEKVKGALGRRVEVKGKVRYKSWDKYPYAVNVEDIVDIYPKDEDLPSFSEIVGIEENITGGVDIVDFVRKLRDEE